MIQKNHIQAILPLKYNICSDSVRKFTVSSYEGRMWDAQNLGIKEYTKNAMLVLDKRKVQTAKGTEIILFKDLYF